ncbi:MAG: Flp family type IVb pilin [Clostridiaceae bacterium]
MMMALTYLKARLGSKKGQGMVEYGLIIGIIAVVIVACLTILKAPLQTLFDNIVDIINGNNGATPPPSTT